MTNNIIMKVANHRAFYLVDVKGTFYNRKKLESMITFRTDFVRAMRATSSSFSLASWPWMRQSI